MDHSHYIHVRVALSDKISSLQPKKKSAVILEDACLFRVILDVFRAILDVLRAILNVLDVCLFCVTKNEFFFYYWIRFSCADLNVPTNAPS